MHSKLSKFLKNKNFLYYKHFGYWKNFSTSNAIINLIENIQQALNDKQIACGIFMDLKKAFDTVDHKLLLSHIGIGGIKGSDHTYQIDHSLSLLMVSIQNAGIQNMVLNPCFS